MDVAQFLQFLLESGTIIQNAPRVARRCPAIKSEDCGVCASTAIQKCRTVLPTEPEYGVL